VFFCGFVSILRDFKQDFSKGSFYVKITSSNTADQTNLAEFPVRLAEHELSESVFEVAIRLDDRLA